MHLPRRVALALALLSLGLAACQQDIGQRCEQGSDCASGYCGESTGGMVSAMGKTCTEPPTAAPSVDAATNDAASNASDASDAGDAPRDVRDAASTDGSGEVSPPDGADGRAGDASPETGGADMGGAETSGADGATDLPESDAGG